MPIEDKRNRDIFLKFCFMYFINHILLILGIDEVAVDILPTETITFKKIQKAENF